LEEEAPAHARLGEVEQAGDQPMGPLGRGEDATDRGRVPGAEGRVPLQQRGGQGDGGQGRAQVMVDDADELLLELRPLAQPGLDALALGNLLGDLDEPPVDAPLVREVAQDDMGSKRWPPLRMRTPSPS
jgi:hypothetical protein